MCFDVIAEIFSVSNVCLSHFARATTLIHVPKYHRFTQRRNFVNVTKYIPNVHVFLAVNNLIYMIEIVYLWLKSDSELPSFQTQKLTYENLMLGAFSCDLTVVANDVMMQCMQRCLGLCETRQLNRYIVIWLARALRALEASQHVIRLGDWLNIVAMLTISDPTTRVISLVTKVIFRRYHQAGMIKWVQEPFLAVHHYEVLQYRPIYHAWYKRPYWFSPNSFEASISWHHAAASPNSVHENRRTCRTFPTARAKCLMRDFINFSRIYKAHQTIVWWTMKVFWLHCT